MQVQITFRHMEHTPALDDLIREKSQKFAKWFGEGGTAHWVCGVEGLEQWSEVRVHTGREEYFAKASADVLYKSIDLVVQKIHNQLE
jgi:putative sigma-54 modulation protein